MPSPLGHSLAALVVHACTSANAANRRDPRRIALVVGAALLPDSDLLLKHLVDGRNHHQGIVHSIGFAVAAGLAAAILGQWRRAERPAKLGAVVGLAYASHLVLDFLSRDTNPPIGLKMLWPLSDGYFKSPWPLFLDVGRAFDWRTLAHNAVAGAWEVVLLAPVAWFAWRVSARRNA